MSDLMVKIIYPTSDALFYVESRTPKDEAEAVALAEPDVIKAMAGKPAKKVIVVPNRIVNVVV
jgi:leucyl-tRNA synthetase